MGSKRNRRPGGKITINGEKLRKIVLSSDYSSGELSNMMRQGGLFITDVVRENQINKYACYEMMGILCIDPEDIDAFDLMKRSEEPGGQMTFLIEPPKEKKKNINEQMLDAITEMKDYIKEIKDEVRRKSEWQQ